jgi:hypothetical protein
MQEGFSTYFIVMIMDSAVYFSTLSRCLFTVGRCSVALRKIWEGIGSDMELLRSLVATLLPAI